MQAAALLAGIASITCVLAASLKLFDIAEENEDLEVNSYSNERPLVSNPLQSAVNDWKIEIRDPAIKPSALTALPKRISPAAFLLQKTTNAVCLHHFVLTDNMAILYNQHEGHIVYIDLKKRNMHRRTIPDIRIVDGVQRLRATGYKLAVSFGRKKTCLIGDVTAREPEIQFDQGARDAFPSTTDEHEFAVVTDTAHHSITQHRLKPVVLVVLLMFLVGVIHIFLGRNDHASIALGVAAFLAALTGFAKRKTISESCCHPKPVVSIRDLRCVCMGVAKIKELLPVDALSTRPGYKQFLSTALEDSNAIAVPRNIAKSLRKLVAGEKCDNPDTIAFLMLRDLCAKRKLPLAATNALLACVTPAKNLVAEAAQLVGQAPLMVFVSPNKGFWVALHPNSHAGPHHYDIRIYSHSNSE